MAVDSHHSSINLCQQRQLHTGGENNVNIQCGEKISLFPWLDGENNSFLLLFIFSWLNFVKSIPFVRVTNINIGLVFLKSAVSSLKSPACRWSSLKQSAQLHLATMEPATGLQWLRSLFCISWCEVTLLTIFYFAVSIKYIQISTFTVSHDPK